MFLCFLHIDFFLVFLFPCFCFHPFTVGVLEGFMCLLLYILKLFILHQVHCFKVTRYQSQSQLWVFLCVSVCYTCACVGFLQVLLIPPTFQSIHIRLTVKLPGLECVSECNECPMWPLQHPLWHCKWWFTENEWLDWWMDNKTTLESITCFITLTLLAGQRKKTCNCLRSFILERDHDFTFCLCISESCI